MFEEGRGVKKTELIAGILLVVSLCAGCGREEQAEERPPLVKTQKLEIASGLRESVYPGTVRGRYETDLSFQTGGRIQQRNVQEGSVVRTGDVLMVIDARDAVQQAGQGDAQAAAALAELNLAQSDLARYSQLYAQDVISEAALDQYQTKYDAALAAYQNALAAAEQGHNVLSYTDLVAGADGVISSVQAEAGQVVAPGQTVMTLVQTGELEVEIQIPENHVADIAVGKQAMVSFWAMPGEVSGIVREIAPMADRVSRTYRVRISLPQPSAELRLGMTASVRFSDVQAGLGASACALPLSAIYQTGDAPKVWLVEHGEVHLREVEVQEFGDNQVLVRGIPAGAVVVTAGVHKLRENQKVRTEGDA